MFQLIFNYQLPNYLSLVDSEKICLYAAWSPKLGKFGFIFCAFGLSIIGLAGGFWLLVLLLLLSTLLRLTLGMSSWVYAVRGRGFDSSVTWTISALCGCVLCCWSWRSEFSKATSLEKLKNKPGFVSLLSPISKTLTKNEISWKKEFKFGSFLLCSYR